jgi:hypothetical protein
MTCRGSYVLTGGTALEWDYGKLKAIADRLELTPPITSLPKCNINKSQLRESQLGGLVRPV